MTLTKEDIHLPNYCNTSSVGKLAGEDILLEDVAIGGLFGRLNFFCRGKKSTGKTQLMRDIYNCFFHGNQWGLWEEGRSDFKPKDLFERLNISLAKGTIDDMPECKAVYSNGKVEYLIHSYKDEEGEPKLTWQKISKEEKDKIEAQFALTTEDLVQLKNVHKKFFCIDEYNRCPEVVMNLFYGLMTGEINHNGEIIKLGNGYYAGMAASNPEDYEGTFKMDFAMWARYHIVLDFDAYETKVKDKDALKKKNLSPGVQEAPPADRHEEIEAVYDKIRKITPTVKERIILQYFQTALGQCTNKSHKGNKEFVDWPRACSSANCPGETKLCGQLKAIDERAVRAMYLLAKGLEEIVRIKTGANIEIDPVESLALAFQFVAPYKGIVSPKASKEKRGIEAIVIAGLVESIKKGLNDKFKDLDAVIDAELIKKKDYAVLARLKERFEAEGKKDEYEEIEKATRKTYEETKTTTKTEILKEFSKEIDAKEKEYLSQAIKDDIDKFSFLILKQIEAHDPQYYARISNLIKTLNWDEKTYAKNTKQATITHKEFQAKAKSSLDDILKQHAEELVEMEDFMEALSREMPKARKQARDKAEIEIIKEKSDSKKIKFIPDEKKPAYEKELKEKLIKSLQESQKAEIQEKKDRLCKDEWEFLKEFYEEYAEERKKQNGK